MDNLCKCGCGGLTIISPKTRACKGWIAGRPRSFIHGHNPKISFLLRLLHFWSKTAFEFNGDWDCIVWTGQISDQGYGVFIPTLDEKFAHRISYILTFGKIPEGKELDHLCRNRRCLNPYHLEAVTRLINVRRGAKCVIDMDIARQIRASSESERKTAMRLGIKRGVVSAVLRGVTWRENV
jgi:hypothetical protein